uniref:CTCHY-type domain-containing protein n=2 Tax=Meloidogyne enterolobii TaxID=390850 RepID=A0A6V7VPP3_MELEN|nr:unnamed protein product [Meloidogyne enterolobii]
MKKQISKKKLKQTSQQNCSIIRKRLNIEVLDETKFFEEADIPNCKHGPCLLFSNSLGEKWFSCAIYRSSKLCGFRINLSKDGTLIQNKKINRPKIQTLPIEEYGILRRRFDELTKIGINPFWCKQCFNFVSNEHEHKFDENCFDSWPSPFQIIDAIKDNFGEAQFWFTENVLSLISNLIEENSINSILCVGTPILFEWLKKLDIQNLFLLDFDDRLSKFYFPQEFARFSILNCYFYLNEGKENLIKFFEKCDEHLLFICDPPFGIQITPLIRTINKLELIFKEIKSSSFNKILFLPYFAEKYLNNTNMSMVDYKVTYTNHKEFSKLNKSTVRIFTNISNKLFKLPKEEGYHFCEICQRFVCKENKHCFKCGYCTSLDGGLYKHCNYCSKCVKRKYIHCKKCFKCHLKERCCIFKND